jgi:GMP reductase
MHLLPDIKLDFKDVLIRPKRSTLNSRKEVDLTRTFAFKHSGHTWTGVPIMASNMDGVGTVGMAQALAQHRMFTCLVKSYDVDSLASLRDGAAANYYAVSTGTSQEDYANLTRILDQHHAKFICIDVANGYSEHFLDFVSRVREDYPTDTIIAGNVVTAEMTEELILRGADLVKVGIGPGSVCTTRLKTGVGFPQLSAIMECADAAHGLSGHIIADGGCTCPGDVAKAFGAGADFVMLGSMFAGHDEGGGEVITRYYATGEYTNSAQPDPVIEARKFVQFYGMSSKTAQERNGGFKEYRASEGKVVDVPYRGSVQLTVADLLGSLRSACTYVGAARLREFSKRTTFVRVTQQLNNIYGEPK